MNLPMRGEVWMADLGMMAKIRPVLVLSVQFGDRDYALFHVVPHTTAVRNSQFEVTIPVPWLKTGVFNIQGSQSIARANLMRLLGTLDQTQLSLIKEAMCRWLGI